MASRESPHGSWSSPFAFILVGGGATLGFSNFWAFPALVASYGGGAFLLVYLLFLLLIGIPLLMSEIVIGRHGRQSPANTMYTLSIISGQHPGWKYLGLACVMTVVLILSYYSVIYGWALGYLFRSMAGKFSGQTTQGVANIFTNFVSNPEVMFAWHTVFMAVTVLIVARGVRQGIEKFGKILVLVIFVILLLLLGNVSTTESFSLALEDIFLVDFSQMTLRGVFEAMKYAFFSLTVGMGIFMMYGAYLPRKASIVKMSFGIVAVELLVSLLAAIIIFSVLTEHSLMLTEGEKLVFITLPLGFGQTPGGAFWGTLFFIALVCSAWTTSIALLEVAVTWMNEKYGIKRIRASIIVGGVIWIIGVFTAFSFQEQSALRFTFKIAGEKRAMAIFSMIEFAAANILLPIMAILLCVFTAWYMNHDTCRNELNIRNNKAYTAWCILVGVVTPAMIFVVFLYVNELIKIKY